MQDLYLYLSGNVPGGFLLLTFIVISINLALYFLYKSSNLFSKQVYQRKTLRFNISLFALYIFLWIYLQPPGLPARVAFLPWQKGDSVDLVIPEVMELASQRSLNDGYFLHRWEWFYTTMRQDSLHFEEYRPEIAEKLGIDIYITGNIHQENGQYHLKLIIFDEGDLYEETILSPNLQNGIGKIMQVVVAQTGVFTSYTIPEYSENQIRQMVQAKSALLSGNSQAALLLPAETGLEFDIIKSRALVLKGNEEKPVQIKSDLNNPVLNQSFQKAQALLIPYSKEENDNEDLNNTLARLYMYMGDYETAEVCLDRAASQNRYDSRVYFLMSFLHRSRFAELGFEDRKSVLEESIRLDPGYALAVYELADEYYRTGIGTASGYSTVYAMNLLKDFSKLNSTNYNVLSLLGKIYLQTKHTLEAKAVFTILQSHYPDSAENCYNLGICFYHLKNLEEAEKLFKRAIELSDDDDSYLYLGAIYKNRGEDEVALEYFRERIRRKSGDDDHYAREAMRQVRIILDQDKSDSLKVETDEDQITSN